jgi:VWFA-related protein
MQSNLREFMRIALLLLLMSFSCFGYTQDASPVPAGDSPAAIDDSPTIHVSSQFVVLDALVEQKKTGTLIGNLQASDFTLSEDGAPQHISYFSHDQLPLSVVFLFDLTMSVRPALEPLAEGARAILGHLKPQDEVAVMVFSSHTELLQGFTTDRSLAADAIGKASKMKSGDGTFIHESMYEAVGQAMKSTVPGSRKVMVWFTDGTANVENARTQKTLGREAPAILHTKDEATDKLLRSGVVVSELIERTAATGALLFAADATPFAMMYGARTGDIHKYADLTGGPVLNTSKKEATDRLAELIDQLRGRYTLGYKPTMVKPEGTFCKLQLQLSADAGKDVSNERDVVVRTKSGYYR